jgi:hypothetical protein
MGFVKNAFIEASNLAAKKVVDRFDFIQVYHNGSVVSINEFQSILADEYFGALIAILTQPIKKEK